MLERIILAAIMTFCIYLFLNLGAKSSEMPSLETTKTAPNFFQRVASFSF